MSISKSQLTLAAATWVLAALATSAAAQVRICPLGDSIIQSLGGQASARYYLHEALRTGGYSFDFVGHNWGPFAGQALYQNWDQDHEAYGGWQVDHVLLELQGWVRETQPDVVLIHLGTNDLIQSQSASSTATELGQCIDVMRGENPEVTVLISKIIPMTGRAVEPLNSLIPGLVASKDTLESRVVVVDHYTGFDPAIHLGIDGLHPTDAGEQFMAQAWYDVLRDFLTPSGLEFQTRGPGCSGATPQAPEIRPIRGQAASLGNPFTVRIDGAPAGASAFAILGFDPAAYYGTPLPLDLSTLGATGCALRVGPDLTLPLTNPGGTTNWTLEVPDNPVLVGGQFFQQALFLGAGLNALGMIFSSDAQVTVVEGS